MFMFSFSLDVLVFSVLALIMIISFNFVWTGKREVMFWSYLTSFSRTRLEAVWSVDLRLKELLGGVRDFHSYHLLDTFFEGQILAVSLILANPELSVKLIDNHNGLDWDGNFIVFWNIIIIYFLADTFYRAIIKLPCKSLTWIPNLYLNVSLSN